MRATVAGLRNSLCLLVLLPLTAMVGKPAVP